MGALLLVNPMIQIFYKHAIPRSARAGKLCLDKKMEKFPKDFSKIELCQFCSLMIPLLDAETRKIKPIGGSTVIFASEAISKVLNLTE